MRSQKVLMRTLAAGPERVLQPGKSYQLPGEVAAELIAGNYASPAERGAKITPLPMTPDPQDTPGLDDDDADDDAAE